MNYSTISNRRIVKPKPIKPVKPRARDVFLSCLGWIGEDLTGNRLRWGISTAILEKYGLPDRVLIERAEVERQKYPQSVRSLSIPDSWWDDLYRPSFPFIDIDTIHLRRGFPVRLNLRKTVQAVRFTYEGRTTRMRIYDERTRKLVLDRIIKNGENVLVEYALISEIVFYTSQVKLKRVQTLDLFRSRRLKFTRLAELSPLKSIDLSHEMVYLRYPAAPTLVPEDWEGLRSLASDAVANREILGSEDLSAWGQFQLALGARWECSVLFGLGFLDGGSTVSNELDSIDYQSLLRDVPTNAVVYRVQCVYSKEKRLFVSNLAVCQPLHIPKLTPPVPPELENAEVRLIDYESNEYQASGMIHWRQFDDLATGMVIEQKTSHSSTIGTPESLEIFELRSKLPQDKVKEGHSTRCFKVPFHDVAISFRARSIDAWDRFSDFSDWSDDFNLKLIHNPMPPSLLTIANALENPASPVPKYESGEVTLPIAEWIPDNVVENAEDSTIQVCRRVSDPDIIQVFVGSPVRYDGSTFTCTCSGGYNLDTFEDGHLIVGQTSYLISRIEGNKLFIELTPNINQSFSLFSSGNAKLQQSTLYEDLWTKVADFPVLDLPSQLKFQDNGLSSVNDAVSFDSYMVRVKCLGYIGSPSNIAQIMRKAPALSQPPPFTIDVLGVDYFSRTMIGVSLTGTPSESKFTLWWALGDVSASDFADCASSGEYGEQYLQDGLRMYEIFAIPRYRNKTITITIGMQEVKDDGRRSEFKVNTIDIPPSLQEE